MRIRSFLWKRKELHTTQLRIKSFFELFMMIGHGNKERLRFMNNASNYIVFLYSFIPYLFIHSILLVAEVIRLLVLILIHESWNLEV